MIVEILNGIYGVIAKNANGYLTKKGAGPWDYKILAKDIGFGIIAFGIGFGAKQLLNIDLTETQILNSAVYMLLTQVVDKWYYAIKEKITTKNLPDGNKNKFKFLG